MGDTGLHVLTLNAGVQRGCCAESRCLKCRRFFVGCWSFNKNDAGGTKDVKSVHLQLQKITTKMAT